MTRLLYIAGGIVGAFGVVAAMWLIMKAAEYLFGKPGLIGLAALYLAVMGGLFGLSFYQARRK